jgi:P27 family predicted phage terminase small subunit
MAPRGIRKEAKDLWHYVHREFEVDKARRDILRVAVISYSRFLDANEILDNEELVIKSGGGMYRKHPAVEIVKIERAGFLAAIKELGLDADDMPKNRPGRPLEGRV